VTRALATGLRAVPGSELAQALTGASLGTEQARIRAADLLATGEPVHLPMLQRMLSEPQTPRAALAVTEALLAHGVAPDALGGRVPSVVLDLALRRRQAPPTFRTVQPGAPR